MTALRKADGGVRGIVAGDVICRLVARTISQQLSQTVEAATAPFQYALSTHAGCECIAHTLQGLTELNPRATVVSIDGISACDQISRAAMLSGLLNVEGGGQALPFVRMFYSSPSSYSWEDSCGVSHTIRQGEGGEQGDALMPLLFALGQHRALVAIQSELQDGEFAYLDDICTVVPPDRLGAVRFNATTFVSECTLARRRCGTGKASDPQLATCWNVSPWQQTPQHGCGEDQATRISPKLNRA